MADPVRLTGLDGTIALNTSAYTGADCTNCTLTVTQGTIEGAAKADVYEVRQVHRRSASGSIGKLVVAIAFTKSALLGVAVPLVLTAETGEEVFNGNVIITKIGWTSPDGYQAEDLDWISSGEFSLNDGV